MWWPKRIFHNGGFDLHTVIEQRQHLDVRIRDSKGTNIVGTLSSNIAMLRESHLEKERSVQEETIDISVDQG